ncbi:MAG: glycogen/starch/alpha-glucan phosphorylase, partial [Thermoleophilaceae bacterium]|nr:glycogen/starch/alpha-glucan phosphorylase [Thermoleophilaceae bacterium]
MEFGLHERLPIYSGGLGVLAGDHLKAAAELGVPLVGVGLLYRGGYFRQGVDAAGRQTEDYQPVDPEAVGVTREPVSVSVEIGGETIEAAVWRKEVGLVTLYLLEVGWLTDALYGGDREHRIRQELLLGVGGV